ncbi:MAG: proteobacterial dedicated sortase system histidine kinase, partial [Burkholderiales bacterium]|nr:proteobacterial dedicated sortase system histidine kinase [Burkholderiales bacterium]
EIDAILRGLQRTTSRIWVVNREYRVIALAGSLRRPQPAEAGSDWLGRLAQRLFSGLIAGLADSPTEDFEEGTPEEVLASGREVAAALQGAPRSRSRSTPDARAVIVSAAYPVWNGNEIAGAVVVEETTNSILSFRNRALERLLLATLAAFVVAGAVLFALATRISWRIRRLRDEAEGAIDARGRIGRLVSGSDAGDEIGDLSRSFSAILARLAEHHAYLEAMASRLSHELRTPVAVVRSSLENLKLGGTPAQTRVYLERAEEGLARLATILTRMSEASRLEQSLSSTARERFDLGLVAAGCVAGYRVAFPQRVFEWKGPRRPVMVEGSPDLMAQFLDKLAENAHDFGAAGTPVEIELSLGEGEATLSVTNRGEPLPEAMRERLFDSMVSVRRDTGGGKPHLGLGLYVARVIAEFHRGSLRAENLSDGTGVRFALAVPTLP